MPKQTIFKVIKSFINPSIGSTMHKNKRNVKDVICTIKYIQSHEGLRSGSLCLPGTPILDPKNTIFPVKQIPEPYFEFLGFPKAKSFFGIGIEWQVFEYIGSGGPVAFLFTKVFFFSHIFF